MLQEQKDKTKQDEERIARLTVALEKNDDEIEGPIDPMDLDSGLQDGEEGSGQQDDKKGSQKKPEKKVKIRQEESDEGLFVVSSMMMRRKMISGS
jgi:hypothetical protein